MLPQRSSGGGRRREPSIRREADAIFLGQLPEPVLIEVSLSRDFFETVRRPVEERIAERAVVVTRGVGDPVRPERMVVKRLRPCLRGVVRQAAVNDLRRGADTREAEAAEVDQRQIARQPKPDPCFAADRSIGRSVRPGSRRKVSAKAPRSCCAT